MLARTNQRQSIRRIILFVSFLLFPLVINYFSPYIIIDSASNGTVNGSFIVFVLLFIASLVFGRAWCGWVCPAGAMQEFATLAVNKKTNPKTVWIKWVVWGVWIAVIAAMVIAAGGYKRIQPFYFLESYISIDHPAAWIIYYFVITSIVLTSFLVGNRGMCHYFCWMAPFMIIGRKLRNLVRWPSLRLQADTSACSDCKRCTLNCPMSLDVNAMVKRGVMENSECILCGNCIDNCSKKVIQYTWSAGK